MFSSSCLSFCIYCIVYVHITGWMPLLRNEKIVDFYPDAHVLVIFLPRKLNQRVTSQLAAFIQDYSEAVALYPQISPFPNYNNSGTEFWGPLFTDLYFWLSDFVCCFSFCCCFLPSSAVAVSVLRSVLCALCLAWGGTENVNLLWLDSCIVIYFVINLHCHFEISQLKLLDSSGNLIFRYYGSWIWMNLLLELMRRDHRKAPSWRT